jgi:hypothetical protein
MVLPKDFAKLSAYFNATADKFIKAKTAEERRDLLVVLKEIVAETKRAAGNEKTAPQKSGFVSGGSDV